VTIAAPKPGGFIIYEGNNLDTLRSMPTNSVDSIVTDPPYGLSFMGKKWDYDVPSVELWAECLRVLKPGGHLLAFAGTRTQHRMAVRIEDAGFEIRDMIAWVYGSGFPKSLDISKAIDNAAGAEREVVGTRKRPGGPSGMTAANGWNDGPMAEDDSTVKVTAPATEAARQWEGWGTALKPAMEPVTVARKPFDTTVAENVLTHGTGGLNIDGCRVATEETISNHGRSAESAISKGVYRDSQAQAPHQKEGQKLGRWPANLIHDGSEEVVAGFPQSSITGKRTGQSKSATVSGTNWLSDNHESTEYTDSGSAARFFYCAKASKTDRDEGCGEIEPQQRDESRKQGDPGGDNPRNRGAQPRANHHPTVKPTDLMRYLCRLVTPPGGTVLDPFMGSGSTGKAAVLEGFRFIGCEIEPEYVAIARKRIAAVEGREEAGEQPRQMSLWGVR
jgi:site-specific DNA-methyltransferase (adenine-specific)